MSLMKYWFRLSNLPDDQLICFFVKEQTHTKNEKKNETRWKKSDIEQRVV